MPAAIEEIFIDSHVRRHQGIAEFRQDQLGDFIIFLLLCILSRQDSFGLGQRLLSGRQQGCRNRPSGEISDELLQQERRDMRGQARIRH
ncbi:hypothetical protein D3C87_1828580 [compost metagenome]